MKTLYFNGPIITMDQSQPQVTAVLVANKKIVAVGSYEELTAKIDQTTKRFNLHGMTMLPGFIESHAHACGFARSLEFVSLATPALGGSIKSVADIKQVLQQALAQNDQKYHEQNWLIGHQYDYNNFLNHERLTKFDLDEVTKEIPILICHLSHHAGVANSKLLEILNISEDTIDDDDLSFERVPGTKEPNGVLKETTFMKFPAIAKMIEASPNQENWSNLWAQVVNLYAAQGYTAVKDGYLQKAQYEFLNYLDKKNELVLDVVGHIAAQDEELLHLMKKKWELGVDCGNKFKVKGIKIIADGTLELWTAWLSQPYCTQINQQPLDYAGQPTIDLSLAYDRIAWCLMNNKQIIVHCIGDQASETFINYYQEALAETKSNYDIRPVMIHATTVRHDQLVQMKELAMTPSFLIEDVYYFDNLYRNYILGHNRSEVVAPCSWAKNIGLLFSLHHDSPVFVPDAIMTLATAVTRKTFYNEILGPEQQITIQDALAALTIHPAYQFHEDDVRGSIAVGKAADFVILNHSPLAIATNRLQDIKVMYTIKDGAVIYTNEKF